MLQTDGRNPVATVGSRPTVINRRLVPECKENSAQNNGFIREGRLPSLVFPNSASAGHELVERKKKSTIPIEAIRE